MRKLIICLLCSTLLLTSCSLSSAKDRNKSDFTQEISDNSNEKEKSHSGESLEEHVHMEDISEEVKDYIINRQDDKSEATKLKWSRSFLVELDITDLYEKYISEGGKIEDVENFAKYITLNAEVPENWQEIFEKDLYEIYGEKVSKLEHLEGDLYQAYVEKDEKEIPYVVVSSRTGYFHG